MTREGWKRVVESAVQNADKGDVSSLDLLVTLLTEQDQAKEEIRRLGFGVTGMPWLDMVDEIREYVQSHPKRGRS